MPCPQIAGFEPSTEGVSKKHLPNYLNEFEFRWNTRKLDDGQRVTRAIRRVDGKRLQYRESVDNPPYLVQVQQPPAPFGGEGVILNPYGDIDLGKPE